MAVLNLNQTSFTSGELSPRVLGRTDIDRYGFGVKLCRNAIVTKQGGVKRRPGSMYVGAADTAVARSSILIPFIQGADSAWMIEFSNVKAKVYNSDRTYSGTQLTSPYTSAQLAEIDWAQSDNTLWLFHPDVPVHRLQRLDGGAWVLSPAPFTTLPFAETGVNPSTTATLSSAAVGAGRTLSSTAGAFEAADVGRGIISGPGLAVITGYTSSTQVTVEITRAFAGTALASQAWTIDSSPQTDCTPGAKDPVGTVTTLTLATAGWRASDVGSMVRINGGLLKITSISSATVVQARILRALSANVAAPALSWSLEPPSWSPVYGYPRSGTVYQQRLILAGNRKFPRTVWGSRSGEPLDFERWTDDSDSFAFTIDSDESTPIRFVSGSQELVVLTESAEYSMRGGVEKPITPTNVRVKPESSHGCSQVRPVQINREAWFVQRAGRKVRAMGYRYDFDGYSSPDATALADHITESGVVSMTYAQETEGVIWASLGNGRMVSCTLDRDQQPSVIAWCAHPASGFVEWVASIPAGDRDEVWAIVRRTVNGSEVRYIEVLDDKLEPWHPSMPTPPAEGDEDARRAVYGYTVDCGKVFDNASGQTTFSVPHLAGLMVDIVADGAKQPRQTVPAGGSITIGRVSKRTLIGLPFRTVIRLLTPEVQTQLGSAQGVPQRTGRVSLHVLESIGAKVSSLDGTDEVVPPRTFGPGQLDQPPMPFTGFMDITKLGWAKGRSEVSIIQDDPLPLHVLSVVRRQSIAG